MPMLLNFKCFTLCVFIELVYVKAVIFSAIYAHTLILQNLYLLLSNDSYKFSLIHSFFIAALFYENFFLCLILNDSYFFIVGQPIHQEVPSDTVMINSASYSEERTKLSGIFKALDS